MGIVKGWIAGEPATVTYRTRKMGDMWEALILIGGEEKVCGAPCKWRSTAHRRAEKAARTSGVSTSARPLSEAERRRLWADLISAVSGQEAQKQELWKLYKAA